MNEYEHIRMRLTEALDRIRLSDPSGGMADAIYWIEELIDFKIRASEAVDAAQGEKHDL